MALTVLQATANETPDSSQVVGDLAVTTPSNTGHASTITSAAGGASAAKSCRWFTFQVGAGQILSVTLKIDHTSSGSLTGLGVNSFTLDYSLNNGGSWTNAVTRTEFTAAQGPTTFSVALSPTQDISQVQVRALYTADSFDVGDAASVTATIANIKVEVTTVDAGVIVLM